MTWESELDSWVASLESKGRTTNYLANARSALGHLARRFDPDSFLDLSRNNFVTWFNELRKGGITGKKGLSDATMNYMAALAKACLRWLNDGETPKSLRTLGAIGQRRSRVEAKEDLLTDPEFESLVGPMPLDKRVILRLLRHTGARPSEILGLRRKDVQTLEKEGKPYVGVTFRNTKTKTSRFVPVGNPTMVQEVKSYLEGTEGTRDSFLFPSPARKGEPMLYGSLHAYVKKKAKAVGIDKDASPYMLRHKRATELMDANIPRKYANELMGWKGTMWDNYAHLGKDTVLDWVLEHETVISETPSEELQRRFDEIVALIRNRPELGVSVQYLVDLEGTVKSGEATTLHPVGRRTRLTKKD